MTNNAIKASYIQPAYNSLPPEARYVLGLAWLDARIHRDGYARMHNLIYVAGFPDSISFSYGMQCLLSGGWLDMPHEWILAFYRCCAPGHQRMIDAAKERKIVVDLAQLYFETREGA